MWHSLIKDYAHFAGSSLLTKEEKNRKFYYKDYNDEYVDNIAAFAYNFFTSLRCKKTWSRKT